MLQNIVIDTIVSLSSEAFSEWLMKHAHQLNYDLVAGLRMQAEQIGQTEADLTQALEVLDKAAIISESIDDPLALALVWRGRANVFQWYERFQESDFAVQQAVAIYEEHGTSYDIAIARTLEVYLLGISERFDEAIALAKWIKPYFDETNFIFGQANLALNVAHTYYFAWQLPEALATYQEAHHLFLQAEDPLQAARLLHNIGVVADELDQLDLAQTSFEQSYQPFIEANDKLMLVKIKYNQAQICLRQSQFDDALAHLTQARADLTYLSDSTLTSDNAIIDYFEARVRLSLNQKNRAEALLENALTHFDQSDENRIDMVQVLLLQSQLLAAGNAINRIEKGLTYLEQAEQLLQQADLPLLSAWLHLSQGELLLLLGKRHEAKERALLAQATFIESNLPIRRAQSEILLAKCITQTDATQASQLYQANLEYVKDLVSQLAIDCWFGLGQVAEQDHNYITAQECYEQAIIQSDLLRRTLHNHQNQASFQEDKQEIPERLLALLHQRPGAEYDICHLTERFKANALADLLTHHSPDVQTKPELMLLLKEREKLSIELDQYLAQITFKDSSRIATNRQRGPSLAAHDRYKTQNISQVRQRIQEIDDQISRLQDNTFEWRAGNAKLETDLHSLFDQSSIGISFYDIADQLYALTVTHLRDDIQIHPLNISLSEIEQRWAQTRRQLIRPRSSTRNIQTRLGYLWAHLIAPLMDRLKDKQRLIIIPHRALFHIPFACLYDRSKQQYLIERWSLQLAPSLKILAHCQEKKQTSDLSLLIGYSGQPDQLGYLPAVDQELQSIRHLLPQAKVISGKSATLTHITESMPDRQLIHLASHTIFDAEHPLESGTLVAENRWLRASDLYLRYGHLSGATVVLSSCNSGSGKTTGSDILGLTSAYFYAGAASVIAGLWSVDDMATAELMIAFYRFLHDGFNTVQALQKAQCQLLDTPEYTSPYYWGAFMVNGSATQI